MSIINILFPSTKLKTNSSAPGDGQKPKCQRCEKTGSSCLWQDSPSGFRHGSSASARYNFADDQPWLPIGQGTITTPTCLHAKRLPEELASCTYYVSASASASVSGIADYSYSFVPQWITITSMRQPT